MSFTPSIGSGSTNTTPTSTYDITITPKNKQVAEGVAARTTNMPDAEKKLFQALASSLDIAPDAKLSPDELKAALDKVEAAVKMIASSVSPNMVDLIARLAIEQAYNRMDEALDSRLLSRQVSKSELLQQAAEMNESADKMLAGAIVSLVLSVVMGGISLGMSVNSVRKAAPELGDLKDAANSISDMSKKLKTLENIKLQNPNMDPAMMNKLDDAIGKLQTQLKSVQNQFQVITSNIQQLQNVAQNAQMANGIAQTIGNSTQSSLQASGKADEAEGARMAALAEDEKAQADIAKQMMDAVQELLRSIMAFLRDMQEAEVQMMQAITRA